MNFFTDSMINKRDITLDITRTICILWIVGYYHLANYVQDDFFRLYLWDGKHGKLITICVLSAFTFLSGYFLKKYQIYSKSDAFAFYKKRVRRFWIPFFLSAMTLHIASLAINHPWFDGHWHFLATILGFSIFTPPSPGTIWYISMLMSFYMITPLILYLKPIRLKLCVSLGLIVVMGILVINYNLNVRVIYYLPVYLCSLLIPSRWVDKVKKCFLKYIFISLAALILTIYLQQIRWIAIVASMLFGPIFLISSSSLLTKSNSICKISEIISYSSMIMYLFHRHIFMSFVFFFGLFGIGSFHEMKTPIWLLLLIVLPFIIIFSYYFQKLYDRACKNIGW